jgi:uncharacterized protein (DUF488 family)
MQNSHDNPVERALSWQAGHDPLNRPPMPFPIFTIGHSTRTIEQFVALLRAGGVATMVDIRSVPRSRTNPQYNPDALVPALAGYRIGHTRIAGLGGLRKRSQAVAPEVNGFWSNRSFHNYADYALSPDFRAGLAALEALAGERRCAMMCAEAVWWRCHRRIVADYLLAEGREVFHLMGRDRVEPARMTSAAVRAADGLHYPAAGSGR